MSMWWVPGPTEAGWVVEGVLGAKGVDWFGGDICLVFGWWYSGEKLVFKNFAVPRMELMT